MLSQLSLMEKLKKKFIFNMFVLVNYVIINYV